MIAAGCSPPQPPNFSLIPHSPAWQGRPSRTRGSREGSPEASGATSHRPQSVSPSRPAWPQRAEVGPQGPSCRTGHALASTGGQGGAHTVSHGLPSPLCPDSALGPTAGGGGRGGWQTSPHPVTFFALADLLPAPVEDGNWSPGSHPKANGIGTRGLTKRSRETSKTDYLATRPAS